MSFDSARHVSQKYDLANPGALRRSIDLARLALRSSGAFIWMTSDDVPIMLCGSRETGLDTATIRDMPAENGVRRHDDGATARLAVTVRLGADTGILCVTAATPRTFDDAELATLQAIGALVEALDDQPRLPLQALVDLSGVLLRKAQDADMPAAALLAAADSLDGVAARLRELSTPPATAQGGRAAARILLADDLDLNRRLIADMLSLDGHRVDCVGDGAAAVRAVTAERYDLVLMDMIMPEMDGLAATRAIRALPGPKSDVPIVALTANSARDQLDSCLEAGMDAALTKPMSLDALSDAVAHWTRGRHAA